MRGNPESYPFRPPERLRKVGNSVRSEVRDHGVRDAYALVGLGVAVSPINPMVTLGLLSLSLSVRVYHRYLELH